MSAIEQAKAYALQKTGLKWDRLDKWSGEERSAYLAANAEFRRDNAQLFTMSELAAGDNYAAAAIVKDEEFSYVSEFIKEGGAQVGSVLSSVAQVGEGLKSGLNLTRWLIPAALVAVVVIALFKFSKK